MSTPVAHVKTLKSLRKDVEAQDGLILKVLCYLDLSAVMRFQRVNKRWKDLSTKTIDDNFPAKTGFTNRYNLDMAVKTYCTKNSSEQYMRDSSEIDRIARTYGYPINKWQVGKVEDFSCVFLGAKTFNEYIGDWDTSQGTNFGAMFHGAKVFNQYIGDWDTSQGTNFEGMFHGAEAFNQYIGDWDTSQGTDFGDMFHGAKAFNQDLSKWNTSKAKVMRSMFYGAESFNQPLASWDISRWN